MSDGVRTEIVDNVTEVEVVMVMVLVAGSVRGPDASSSAQLRF